MAHEIAEALACRGKKSYVLCRLCGRSKEQAQCDPISSLARYRCRGPVIQSMYSRGEPRLVFGSICVSHAANRKCIRLWRLKPVFCIHRRASRLFGGCGHRTVRSHSYCKRWSSIRPAVRARSRLPREPTNRRLNKRAFGASLVREPFAPHSADGEAASGCRRSVAAVIVPISRMPFCAPAPRQGGINEKLGRGTVG